MEDGTRSNIDKTIRCCDTVHVKAKNERVDKQVETRQGQRRRETKQKQR